MTLTDGGYLKLFEDVTECLLKNLDAPSFINRVLTRTKELQDRAAVCSFSKIYNSILMWSHYSDYHKGFCLGYDFHNSGLKHNLEPVIYDNNMLDVTDFMLYGQLNPFFMKYIVMRKAEVWSYEKEWRLIFLKPHENIVKVPTPQAIYLGYKMDGEKEDILVKIAREKQMKVFKMKMLESSFLLRAEPFTFEDLL